jgi:hypothetical protein
MKEFLRQLNNTDFDGINFYLNEDGDVEVSQFNYKTPGEKTGGTELGDFYDIIIIQNEPPKMPERFQAILISPLEYISRMIDDGFCGVVSRVTTTSKEAVDYIMSAMEEETAEYIENYEKEMKNV